MDKIRKTFSPTVVAAIMFLLLHGCRARTVYVPVVETHTVTETVKDTVVDVRLVVYKDSVAVRDTVSRLENPYAQSLAIWSGGMLGHTLEIKDITVPVRVEYVDRVETVVKSEPYPVEVIKEINVLKTWQIFLIRSGAVAWLALLVLLFVKLRKLF